MRRFISSSIVWLPFALLALSAAAAGDLKFRVEQISDRLTVGYAVRLVDMNDDGQLDLVVVDSERVIWFENPSWKLHTLIEGQTKKDNVSIAAADIDGDGKVDFALGADWRPSDTRTSGSLEWLSRGKAAEEKWTVHPIGSEPTVHRIRFADLDGDGRPELIVVPLFGRGTSGPDFAEAPLRILAFAIPDDPVQGPWKPTVINEELHVAHNFLPTDLDHDGQLDILVASFEGVSLLSRAKDGSWKRTLIGSGNQQTSPSRGASEVKHGRLGSGADYVATIEPWHGFQVVVYTRPEKNAATAEAKGDKPRLWRRQVLDEELKWGHAVWCADLDGDADHELVIGVRDSKDAANPCGLRIYDPANAEGTEWTKHVFDPGGVAIEDLAVGDLDGDGDSDIVAVGRRTRNVRIYWNLAPQQQRDEKGNAGKAAGKAVASARKSVAPAASDAKVYFHPITVTGTALDPDGRPIAGARVYLASLAGQWKRVAETTTDSAGRYEFRGAPLPIRKADSPRGADRGAFEVFGQATGLGFTWRPRKSFYPGRKFVIDNSAALVPDRPNQFGAEDTIELDLQFSRTARLQGRIVDDEGRPISDCWLAIRYCEPLGSPALAAGYQFESLNQRDSVPPDMKLRVTDDRGRFAFSGLPADCRFRIDVRPAGFPRRRIWAATTDEKQPKYDESPVLTGEIKLVFPRPLDIPVKVVYGDTGQPADRVLVGGSNREADNGATTDARGQADLRLPPGEYKLRLLPARGTPYLMTEQRLVVGRTSPGEPVVARLRPACVIEVSVVDAHSGRGLAGVDLWHEIQHKADPDPHRELLDFRSWEVETGTAHVERPRSDEDGRIRALVESGTHRIGVGWQSFPNGYSASEAHGREIEARGGRTVHVQFKMEKNR